MNDVWTCCQCKASNLTENADKRCPVCEHTRCGDCHEGRLPFFLGLSHSVPIYSSTSAGLSSPAPRNPSRSYVSGIPAAYSSASRYQDVRNMYQPYSLPGWWYCCYKGCNNLVNPHLSAGKCPIDGHPQCSRCTQCE